MAVLRFFSWILVALGLMLLGADAMSSLEAGKPFIRTTMEVLGTLGVQVTAMDGGGVAPVVNFLLEAPLWAIIGLVGVVLTLVFRPID